MVSPLKQLRRKNPIELIETPPCFKRKHTNPAVYDKRVLKKIKANKAPEKVDRSPQIKDTGVTEPPKINKDLTPVLNVIHEDLSISDSD